MFNLTDDGNTVMFEYDSAHATNAKLWKQNALLDAAMASGPTATITTTAMATATVTPSTDAQASEKGLSAGAGAGIGAGVAAAVALLAIGLLAFVFR